VARLLGAPGTEIETLRGREDFDFPGTRRLLELAPRRPDVVHCHNLHGNYFDLRFLPTLSGRVPTLLTLHDAWMLSGHCAHSLECERWRTGCGNCPHLEAYPTIRRDGTACTWRRKSRVYDRCRLFVATPCRWLLRKVEQSILAPAVVEGRVIPNGVDRTVFTPGDRRAARKALGLPPDAPVLLFVANVIRGGGYYKDFRTLREVVARLATRGAGRGLIFIGLGEEAPPEQIGQATIRFVPHQKDPRQVALYYQAASLYVHAARADTFPNVILEALACGLPVAATAVCGIPEQVQGLPHPAAPAGEPTEGPESATGLLVPAENPDAMLAAVETVLVNPDLQRRLSANAVASAAKRFDLRDQADEYLRFYQDMRARRAALRPEFAR
jgi:glycosyltransferase involved in cell wall biosynthesis